MGSFLYELARRHEREPPPARELRERWEALQFERLQGELALLPRGARRQPRRVGGRARLPLERARRRGAGALDGELAAVPGHRAGAARGARGRPAAVDHLQHRPGDHRAHPAPHRGRVRRRDGGRGLPRLQAVDDAVRARPARDRRAARADPARGLRLQVRHRRRRSSSGMRTAWVNRQQEPAPGAAQPDYEWNDLWPLAGWTGPARSAALRTSRSPHEHRGCATTASGLDRPRRTDATGTASSKAAGLRLAGGRPRPSICFGAGWNASTSARSRTRGSSAEALGERLMRVAEPTSASSSPDER